MNTERERERPINCPLASGELMLLMRGMRDFVRSEYSAISAARAQFSKTKREKDRLHAEDVKQHALLRVQAAQSLIAHLQSVGKGDINGH